MKKALVFTFIFLYIMAMLRPVFPLFYYLINQDYIAEFLCINKDRPQLQCKGKCQLSLQLKKQSEEKRKNIPRIQLEDYPIGFIKLLNYRSFVEEIKKKKSFYSNDSYHYLPQFEIFRPPTFLF